MFLRKIESPNQANVLRLTSLHDLINLLRLYELAELACVGKSPI